MKKPFVILVGMSASGKNAVLSELLDSGDFKKVVTTTTRNIREGEKHGVDYFFLSREDFENGLNDSKFLEHEEIYNNYYGMSLEGIKNCLNYKETPITILDPKGAESAKKLIKDFEVITFFVDENIEKIIDRISKRKNESDKARSPEVEKGWKTYMEYDYIIPSILESVKERVNFVHDKVDGYNSKKKILRKNKI